MVNLVKKFKNCKLLANGDSNTKLAKNKTLTFGLSLSPHKMAGVGNLCGFASEACVKSCLVYTGFANIHKMVNDSRVLKTRYFYQHRSKFLAQLEREIANKVKNNPNQDIAIRLNVLSDFPWEKTGIIDKFPEVEFYDYSKNPRRAGLIRPNYWVTFSRSETNENKALEHLSNGKNVAVVFHNIDGKTGSHSGKQTLPRTWKGYKVIDGDETDLRYLDTRGRLHGRVVGLRLKSATKKNRQFAIDSGFSVETP